MPSIENARVAPRFRVFPFAVLVAFHFVPLLALLTGVSVWGVLLCAAIYAVEMFAITAGYHRYFAHRSYKTSRPMAFVLAWLAQTSLQRGVLWWAATHRDHHKYSDTPQDVHSPVVYGFFRSHFTWPFYEEVFSPKAPVTDLSKHAELRWISKHWRLPSLALAVACYALLGWEGVIVGFVTGTLLVYHGAMTINSVNHLWGGRPYETTDQSRNNVLLALATFGEGWHNNHHHYMGSCRQGFRWWQVDLTWYALKGMERLGLVWDLKEPPERVLAEAWTAPAAARGERVLVGK